MIRYAVLTVAIVCGAAWWMVDRAEGAKALAESSAAHLAKTLESERERGKFLTQVIDEQRAQLGRMTEAAQLFRTLTQKIDKDTAAMRRTLQELKENDQAVAEYLRGAVPDVYGVQFARPETIDPAEYQPGRAVPAGGMPPAGPPGDPAK
ncbi:hypothetical protein ACRCP3_26890 [Pseudomonas aeruginosa]|uniref:hypothetical protein n=1 Tax=Pseudomonas aeruginosa TaxID=287 RepID=UPI00227AC045|nr:hypothetical protein [Pseudomonas aeruginosa]WAJ88609.1 hypothetical protein PAC13_34980 [Pseudomonas aeruginosa]